MAMSTGIFSGLLIAALLGYWFMSTSRAATPTPKYQLLKEEGRFSIREYPALEVATTPMESGMNGSFGRLFRFITGANQESKKISMTTPVLIETEAGQRTMSFIMPENTSVPEPKESVVVLRKIPAGKFAALRFSGGRTPENEVAALKKLTVWMGGEGLKASGEPVFAYYDPPWTPTFLRRNEVLVPCR